jgi:hypothetical protein
MPGIADGMRWGVSDFFAWNGGSVSLVISLSALALSALGLYLNRFLVRGPRIFVMNDSDTHEQSLDERGIMALPYELLPRPVREEFPDLKREQPHYATASVVFANAGERTAFVTIRSHHVLDLSGEESAIRAVNYNFLVVPPGGIARHRFLLHNVQEPQQAQPINVDLVVSYTWQGAGMRTRHGRCRVQVTILHPLDA